MSFKKVVFAGCGVLGTQIAFQAAYCGFDVTIWLRIKSSIGRTKPKIELDMKKAFVSADVIIESMSENKDAKISFYKKAAPLMDEKTVLLTNSSMLPSSFTKYTGRPDGFYGSVLDKN